MVSIQEIRKRAGLSRYALAKRTGLSNQGLYMIEKKGRNPTLDTLQRVSAVLAEELGERPADLLAALTALPIRAEVLTQEVQPI